MAEMDDIVGFFGPSVEDDEIMPANLPPEPVEGNIEYKLKLINPSKCRFEHLVTQMKWRLQEGRGEAIYEIGVGDSGRLIGLTENELKASLSTLYRMAAKIGASIVTVREKFVDPSQPGSGKQIAEVLVRKVPDDQNFIEVRVAVLGNIDAGKSTLLGTLTTGDLDNGFGRSRLNLFRHLHEIESGRTSSISHEIFGFDSKGNVINYASTRLAEEIMEKSSKLISLVDLAGHEKYMKTTIFGLTGYYPDAVVMLVSATMGLAGTTQEHLALVLALEVPFIVIINKIDVCNEDQVNRTVEDLSDVLKGPSCRKIPALVNNEDDVVSVACNFHKDSIIPIFCLSCVSGKNLDLFIKFLLLLPPFQSTKEKDKLDQALPEFQIDEVFNVPKAGLVISGTVARGVLYEGIHLKIGPDNAGEYSNVQVKSLHRNRTACRVVRAGQAATAALGLFDHFPLRRGMVAVSQDSSPRLHTCTEFDAKIFLLYHQTCITIGYQTTIFIGNIRCAVTIICIDRQSVHTNQSANVKFSFQRYPQYVKKGANILFRDNVCKGIGEVTNIYIC